MPYYSDPLALLERQRRNALHLAVHFDRIDIIELICRYIKKSRHFTGCRAEDDEQTNVGEGCDCPIYYPHLEDIDAFGDTALQMGVIGPFRQAVSTLLQFSLPQLDTPMRKEKLTPEFLIAQKPLFWRRPLHHAIIHADTHGDMYKTLVDGGADIRLPDCKGQTPLMVAMRDKNEEATQFLRGIKSTTRGVPYNKLFLF